MIEEAVEVATWDEVAEQSVLGSLMLSEAAAQSVEVDPADFYLPKHELVARAIMALVGRGESTDPIAVTEELRHTESLERAGGAAYVHFLTGVPLTPANAEAYVRTVRDLAVHRRLVEAGMRITAMGRSSEGAPDALLESARAELDAVSVSGRKPVRRLGASFNDLLEELEHAPQYVPSPWEALNRLIDGFHPGEVYVVAARPSDGKSLAVLQIAMTIAHRGMVAFSSLEMTDAELQERLLAQYGEVSLSVLRSHNLSKDDWERVARARVAVQDAPLFVDTSPDVTMAGIRAHARAVARKGPLAAVVIDYLQLVSTAGSGGRDRREQVDALSREAKVLAKDLGVPVIAAAQLKRPEKAKGGLPTMSDLREAGGIEQNADVVVLLHRDKEQTPEYLDVIVAKNRHGELGKFQLLWDAKYARLLDKPWHPTAGRGF